LRGIHHLVREQRTLFGIGLVWESVIYLGTLVLILTFPTGRLEGVVAKVILLADNDGTTARRLST
jgi:hypothetical protein